MMNCFSKEMMSNTKAILFTLISVFILNSCTKLDTTTLGSDLIPGSDRLATDTLLVPVSTNSFITNDTTVVGKEEFHALGYLNDPLFGTTTATVFAQLLPLGYPMYPKVKDSLELDSVVLSLAYFTTYGDTNALSKVNVYEITDTSFKRGVRFPVSRGFKINEAQLLGTKTFKATDLRKPYQVARNKDTFTVVNQLRITLDPVWGRRLLDKRIDTSSSISEDSVFKAFLNGLTIVPDSTVSGNAIHYFGLIDTATKINLYYRSRRATPAAPPSYDTLTSLFVFFGQSVGGRGNDGESANSNKVFRNHTGSIAAPFLNSTAPASLAFIQSSPATSVRIKAPVLSTLKGQRYIVHRAELVARQIFQGPATLERQLLPPLLHLYTFDNAGRNASIPFDSISYFVPNFSNSFNFSRFTYNYNINEVYTGATPTTFTDVNNNTVYEYRMNITRYVQNIINGNASLRDFRLEAPYYANFAAPPGFDYNISSQAIFNKVGDGRVQLGGGTHPTYPMFVRIYYSKQ